MCRSVVGSCKCIVHAFQVQGAPGLGVIVASLMRLTLHASLLSQLSVSYEATVAAVLTFLEETA